MKKMKIVMFFSLMVSTSAFANSGGTPNVPCYIDGEYVGTIEITKCDENGGVHYLKKSK